MLDDSCHTVAAVAPPIAISEKIPELESGNDSPDNTTDSLNVNDEDEYASGINLLLLIISLMLGMFLVALDNVCSSLLPLWYIFGD
jgi:hypothetical protein